MKAWRIGLIGYGAIARDVIEELRRRHDGLCFTVLRRGPVHEGGAHLAHVGDLDALVASAPDIVVEAAGHQALMESAPRLLERGVSVIAASVGSLIQDSGAGRLVDELHRIGARGKSRLIIPPGAIGGLDYIGAIAHLDDADIVYTSRKPPQAWADELATRGLSPGDLIGEYVLFQGAVQDAAARYPRNLNVAATLALALGDATRISVRVVVDSTAPGNMHEIACRSAAGFARFEFINAPSPANPKTSLVTALSIVHCVEQFMQTNVR